MNRFEFQKLTSGLLDISGQGKLSVPVSRPTAAGEVTVKRFGIDTAGEVFRTGWQFTIEDQSAAKTLKAFVAGSIRYEASVNRIVLTNLDVFGEIVRKIHLPAWFPLPNYVLYDGIDEQLTRNVLLSYLSERGTVRRLLERTWGPSVLPSDLVDRFMNGELELPISCNQPFAIAKQVNTTSRTVTFSIQVELGNPDRLFVDPSTYAVNCAKHFLDLEEHPLEAGLKRLWGGLLANDTLRYVAKSGGVNGPFTNPAAPANTIARALGAANPYDSVVIIDDGIYQEGAQLEIEQEVTITSLANVNVLNDSVLTSLPTIDGNQQHRCIWIKDNAGMVAISNLGIMNGRINTDLATSDPARHHGTSPAGGGGVVIDEMDQVYISNCHIHHNAVAGYKRNRIGGYSAVAGTDEGNFGGGILVYFCSPFLGQNRITDNVTDRRGGGIGIWGYGWPVLSQNIIANNSAGRSTGGDGGGVSIEIAIPDHEWVGPISLDPAWSDEHIEQARQNVVKFIDNHIVENRAVDDGGGVYLSVMAGAYFENNLIQSNEAGGGGGGIRASFGSSLIMEGDAVLNNRTNFLDIPGTTNGGGGIACRDAQLFLSGVRIEDNEARGWAGGGLVFISSREGGLTANEDADTYDEILAEVFNPGSFTLAIDANSTIANNRCVRLPGQDVDRRKGGGLFGFRFVNDVTEFLAFPLKIIIENLSSIQNNTLESPPDLTFPNSAQIFIDDMVHRPNQPIDDDTVADLATGNSLIYESL